MSPSAGRLLALLLLAVCLAGCGESPTEVFERARSSAEDKDFDAFAGAFTERSASLLEGLREADRRTRGRYRYMKDLFDVLPRGAVQEEDIEGNLATLAVGPSERRTEQVILLRETEGWRIDVFDSPRFWKPLTTEARR